MITTVPRPPTSTIFFLEHDKEFFGYYDKKNFYNLILIVKYAVAVIKLGSVIKRINSISA